MDLRRPGLSAPLASTLFFSILTALPGGVPAQEVDRSQLLRSDPSANGEPFPRRAELPLMAQQAFDVPPLVERPLIVDQGPRVVVSAFELTGAVDRADLGISVATINSMLRDSVAAQTPEGYTVGQLGEIADRVTQYYRERGLILAQAYVPAQDVQGGVVRIGVMEGSLGSVTVEQNAMYRERAVAGPFDRLIDRPVVQSEIEEALLILQEFPGLTIFGTFTQGQSVGETDLLVQVQDEDRFAFTPMVDNYGSEFTGEQRFSVQFDINNPFGARDRISGYALKTFNPENGDYGGLDYEVMTRSGRGAFGFGVSRNNFDVTDASVDVDIGLRGEVEQAHLFHRKNFVQGRALRVAGTLDVATKEAVTLQTGPDPKDELTNLTYQIDFFAAGREQRGINLGHFRWLWGYNDGTQTSRQSSNQEFVRGRYGKLDYSYQRLQRLGSSHSVLFRMYGQYTSNQLVPLEQFALGGPGNVRAYSVATGLSDKGHFASVEWIISPAGLASKSAGTDRRTGRQRYWNEVFQFSFFYDLAHGNVNGPLPGQVDKIDMTGLGLGIQFSVTDRFYVRLDASRAIERPTPRDLIADEDFGEMQYYLSARMTF